MDAEQSWILLDKFWPPLMLRHADARRVAASLISEPCLVLGAHHPHTIPAQHGRSNRTVESKRYLSTLAKPTGKHNLPNKDDEPFNETCIGFPDFANRTDQIWDGIFLLVLAAVSVITPLEVAFDTGQQGDLLRSSSSCFPDLKLDGEASVLFFVFTPGLRGFGLGSWLKLHILFPPEQRFATSILWFLSFGERAVPHLRVSSWGHGLAVAREPSQRVLGMKLGKAPNQARHVFFLFLFFFVLFRGTFHSFNIFLAIEPASRFKGKASQRCHSRSSTFRSRSLSKERDANKEPNVRFQDSHGSCDIFARGQTQAEAQAQGQKPCRPFPWIQMPLHSK